MIDEAGLPSIRRSLYVISEQLRIANLIALRRAWTPTQVKGDLQANEFYLVGNKIDSEISDFLHIHKKGE